MCIHVYVYSYYTLHKTYVCYKYTYTVIDMLTLDVVGSWNTDPQLERVRIQI